MKGLVPLNEKVLVKPFVPPQQLKSGLFVPQTLRNGDFRQGVVIAVSTALPNPQVEPGDTVFFYYLIEHELTDPLDPNTPYMLINQKDLIAKREGEREPHGQSQTRKRNGALPGRAKGKAASAGN